MVVDTGSWKTDVVLQVSQSRCEVQGSCNAAQGPVLAWHLLRPPPVQPQSTTPPIRFNASASLFEPV